MSSWGFLNSILCFSCLAIYQLLQQKLPLSSLTEHFMTGSKASLPLSKSGRNFINMRPRICIQTHMESTKRVDVQIEKLDGYWMRYTTDSQFYKVSSVLSSGKIHHRRQASYHNRWGVWIRAGGHWEGTKMLFSINWRCILYWECRAVRQL